VCADPREAVGYCAGILGASQPFDGVYPSTATGGVSPLYYLTHSHSKLILVYIQTGAGTLDPVMSASNTFPPATVSPSYRGASLPTYTPTGTIHTLPGPTFTAAPKASVGSGWNNPADTELAYVYVSSIVFESCNNSFHTHF
jgi:glucan 1,3-beta-glucosidase